ncbi:hypothetical protein [Croceicoccus sediminis]|uniref:hypothetical protein n=1 Tax=Croceicoccus sediminis TaxID=2571150 RepID=UPI00196B771E|nr:hypothetical protein [Croceicoccus sediminis]
MKKWTRRAGLVPAPVASAVFSALSADFVAVRVEQPMAVLGDRTIRKGVIFDQPSEAFRFLAMLHPFRRRLRALGPDQFDLLIKQEAVEVFHGAALPSADMLASARPWETGLV